MEHMRPEGLCQGYYCMRCGKGGVGMYACNGNCTPNPELVSTLRRLNSMAQQQPDRSHTKAAGGHWVHRDADIHRCNKPSYEHKIKTGDVWECDECHKQWTVKVNDDYRGEHWLTWGRVTSGGGGSLDMRDARPFVDIEQHR